MAELTKFISESSSANQYTPVYKTLIKMRDDLDAIACLLAEIKIIIDKDIEGRAEDAAFPFTVKSASPGIPRLYGFDSEGLCVTVGPMKDQKNSSITHDSPERISVAAYANTDDEKMQDELLRAVDALVSMLGYEGPIDEQTEYGSIFRRSWATVRRGLSSREISDQVAKVERALELIALDSRQAEVDRTAADAVSNLVATMAEIPTACVRVGSILLIKYVNSAGPVVLIRTLSPIEVRVLERYPELQMEPPKVLEGLSVAIASVGDIGTEL
jgi:hypothetical protein